ncbi:unnamed protein product [Orchesella dallaii]|uniref:Uncharacterized protein n=1 Tax=Orchesella dallaii TaxID=48710 RepID=A0ABP1RLX5_9HEXA
MTVSYDWTEPINEIISGNKSIGVILKTLDFPANNSKLSDEFDIAVVYDTDCPIFGECENQIEQAVNLLTEIIERKITNVSFIVALSFRIEIRKLAEINLWKFLKKLVLPSQQFVIFFTIPDSTTCNDFKGVPNHNWETLFTKSTWISSTSQDNFLFVGLGYSESLIGCGELNPAIQKMDFGVTFINFGDTIGITESFNLFYHRLTYLHKQNVAYVEMATASRYSKPELHYYPTPQSVGGDKYQRLLFQYGQTLIPGNIIGVGIVVPPYPKNTNDKPQNRTFVIPYVGSDDKDTGEDGEMWYTPSALHALSNHFETVVLTPG